MKRRWMLLLLCALLWPFSLWAELKLEASLASDSLLLGDETQLELSIDGTQDELEVQLPQVEGLQIRPLGPPSRSSQTVILNGQMQSFSGLVYRFGLTASRLGRFQLPPLQVRDQGKLYQSEGLELQVVAPDQPSKMSLKLTPARSEIYLGETVDITLEWSLQENVEDYRFRLPLLDQKDQLGLKLVETPTPGEQVKLTVDRFEIPFVRTSQKLAEGSASRYQVVFQITPAEAGDLVLAPASVKAGVQRGSSLVRDFFGRLVRKPKLVSSIALSQETKIKVKPLPLENRPADFSGAVGRFELKASLNASRVKVGDPVELKLQLVGQGRLKGVEAPLLTEQPGFAQDFAVEENLQPGEPNEQGLLFRKTIRPRSTQVNQVPPVSLSYFDVEQGAYRRIQSQALPLQVLDAPALKDSDLVLPTGKQADPEKLVQGQTGIYGMVNLADALEQQLLWWPWQVFLPLPPLLVLGLAWFKRKKSNRDLAFEGSQRATKKARQALEQIRGQVEQGGESFYGGLTKILGACLAERLRLGQGEVTLLDLERLREKGLLDAEQTQTWHALLSQLDQARYSGQAAAPEARLELWEEALQAVQKLEKRGQFSIK